MFLWLMWWFFGGDVGQQAHDLDRAIHGTDIKLGKNVGRHGVVKLHIKVVGALS